MATTGLTRFESDFKERITPANIAAEGDPLRNLSAAMAAHSTALAKLLGSTSESVQDQTEKIAQIKVFLNQVNRGAELTAGADDTVSFELIPPPSTPLSKEQALELQKAWNAAGVPTVPFPQTDFTGVTNESGPYLVPSDIFPDLYSLRLRKKDVEAASKNLRQKADEIGMLTQAAQLSLQSVTGRLDGALHMVSATTIGFGTAAGSIVQNFR
jgi:hypothetical protein